MQARGHGAAAPQIISLLIVQAALGEYGGYTAPGPSKRLYRRASLGTRQRIDVVMRDPYPSPAIYRVLMKDGGLADVKTRTVRARLVCRMRHRWYRGLRGAGDCRQAAVVEEISQTIAIQPRCHYGTNLFGAEFQEDLAAKKSSLTAWKIRKASSSVHVTRPRKPAGFSCRLQRPRLGPLPGLPDQAAGLRSAR